MELGNKGEGYPGKLKWFEMKKESPKEITLAEFVELKQPIHQAVKAGDLEAAKRLLADDPANANLRGRNGITPLHRAAMADNAEMVELLISNKADPNIKNTAGYTPLHIAAIQRKKLAAAMLVKNGADPYIRDADAESAFDHARGDPKLIELLTKAKTKE
jgi:ankyrin repeat protein